MVYNDPMKASELIEKLQILIAEHGDLDVYLDDWNEGYAPAAKATEVDYSQGKLPRK
ncbi:MAG: hypothetical protein AB7E55_34010 [Pigmentiphaga sp.]